MGIQKVLPDFGSSPAATSGRESYTPTATEVNSGVIQGMYNSPPQAQYNGGTMQAPLQAPPTQYGYAPAPNGGQGINVNQPLYGPPGGGGATGGGGGAPAAPAVPRGPVQGGRAWYNSLDAGGKAAQDSQWLGGDSDYTDQLGEYDKALKDFVSRITNQKDNFKHDTDRAVTANSDNQHLAGNQLGEDFGARGMSYSGLFDKSMGLQNKRFADQEGNIQRVGQQNQTDADNRLGDFKSQNGIDRNNAMRAALGRMAQQQSIIDSQNPF